MTHRLFLGGIWIFLVCGCPTRTVYYDAGTEATGGQGTGGQSGAGGTRDAGGAAGASSGGESGAGGRAIGGAAGGAGTAEVGGAYGQAGAAAGGAAGWTSAKSKDGVRCALAGECASGVCTPFYVDLDGDGYGAGQAVGFCGPTAPVGYAAQSGDCCDTATNLTVAKLIHPGADFQTTSANGVCNITWDYDCSGAVDESATSLAGCTPYPDCKDMRAPFPQSNCGQTVGLASCGTSTSNTSSCINSGGGATTLGCK